MIYDLIVAGAGPAGLFCAIRAAMGGLRVCVLEKNGSAGKKLLISGSGRCNVTNMAPLADFPARYGDAARFVKPALLNFTNLDLIAYFEERGVPLVEMNGGKVFPSSQKARDILDALLADAKRLGVTIIYESPIETIARDGENFRVRCEGGAHNTESPVTYDYLSKNILVATGGKSYPSTGSTGCGLRIAMEFGHAITETAPALTPLIMEGYRFAECAGISVNDAGIRIVRDGKPVRDARGDVLFTHKGLSGPGILDASRYVRKGDTVCVSLTPETSADALERSFLDAAGDAGTRAVKSRLSALGVPERLALAALALCGVDGTMTLSRLGRDARKKICSTIAALPFTVAEVVGYREAMATRGGVLLSEVNPKTMESKIVPGLYFAGEVLDVDGDSGGFNIQFAFSSGKLTADALIKKTHPQEN